MESAEGKQQKSSRRYDKTVQSCGQICWTISWAIICYYGRARSLCYPTIETGGAPGNLMTHKSRWFFLGRRRASERFTPFFPSSKIQSCSISSLSFSALTPGFFVDAAKPAATKGLGRFTENNINCFNVTSALM